MSRERLIIDGYNLLYAHPEYRPTDDEDMDVARAHLVADLAGFAQGGPRVTVVFDGTGNALSDGTPHHIGQLCVIFSPAGTTADTVIEALAGRARNRGDRVIVVTSDTATRNTVQSGTVAVLSSQQFVEELTADVQARRAIQRSMPRRAAVSERVAPDVRAVLARWARGHVPNGPADAER